jgi:hypothetical protein
MVLGARSSLALSLATAILLSAGCSDGGTATTPVSGKVTLKGSPVAGAQVTFMAEGAPRAAIGTTDSQGRYQLTTFKPNDGAVVGKHTVTIVGPAGTPAEAMSPTNPSAGYAKAMLGASAPKKTEQVGGVPAKYADPKTSELRADVTKGGPKEFNFDLP